MSLPLINHISITIEDRSYLGCEFITADRKEKGWKLTFTEDDMLLCEAREMSVARDMSLEQAISEMRYLVGKRFHPEDGDTASFNECCKSVPG